MNLANAGFRAVPVSSFRMSKCFRESKLLLYRHSQLEHRHIHRYQDECHDYSYYKDKEWLYYVVELLDLMFEFGIRVVCLGQKHLFEGIGLLTDFQQNEETLAI